MRRLISALLLTAFAGCGEDVGPAPRSLQLDFLADFNFPPRSSYADEELGGISAVVYDAASESWLALSDAKLRSRLFTVKTSFEDGELSVEPVETTFLVEKAGESFGDNMLDPEGLVATPWGTLLISTEADLRQEPVEQAKLLEFERSGRLVRGFTIPPKCVVEGDSRDKGVRHNRGFESLTFAPDGERVYVGTESPLLQDGPEASFDRPGFSRIVEYEVSGRELVRSGEYVYPIGPLAPVAGFGDADVFTGLVELVALSDTRLLALERDYIREKEGDRKSVTRGRIFVVDLEDASDVAALSTLQNGDWRPAQKELLLDLDDIVPELSPGYQSLDNFEAMGLGPVLPDGGRSLLVVSDDNFQDTQRTAFLLFRLKVAET